jgi:hypothetical protein
MLYIKVLSFGEVVIGRAWCFVVRQPCLAVCFIVTLVGQDLGIGCTICAIVALVEQAVAFVIIMLSVSLSAGRISSCYRDRVMGHGKG